MIRIIKHLFAVPTVVLLAEAAHALVVALNGTDAGAVRCLAVVHAIVLGHFSFYVA